MTERLGLQGWVVYPTREEIVVTLARRRDELARHLRIPTPGWETTQWAWDKRKTQELAERLRIPTARTWTVPDAGRLFDVLPHDVRYPLVIKPAIKEHFLYKTGAKAWRADHPSELADRVRAAEELIGPGEVLVQERIPGGGSRRFAFCTFFKNGDSVASLTVRRTRQHPPEFGRASTLVESVDIGDLEEPSVRFLREIGFYGLAELEYMFDERDGTYVLLDVNARAWGYHSIGAEAGVDFSWLVFADQLGIQATGPRRGRAGVRWIRVLTDLPTAAVEMAQRSLAPRDYLASLRPRPSEAVFSRDDPGPGIAELALLPYLIVKRGF